MRPRVISQVDASLGSGALCDLFHAGSEEVFELLNVIVLILVPHYVQFDIFIAKLIHVFLPRLHRGSRSLNANSVTTRLKGLVVMRRVLIANYASEGVTANISRVVGLGLGLLSKRCRGW